MYWGGAWVNGAGLTVTGRGRALLARGNTEEQDALDFEAELV